MKQWFLVLVAIAGLAVVGISINACDDPNDSGNSDCSPGQKCAPQKT